MKVIVAFTPAIAFSVSRALNCTDKLGDDIYTNDGETVTVAYIPRETVQPFTPKDYAGGKEFFKQLPFTPKSLTYAVDRTIASKFYSILREAEEVIFASDGGMMEQGLFALLCQAMQVGCKTSRMILTALTNPAINSAYMFRMSGRHITRLGRIGTVMMAQDFLFRTNFEYAFAQAFGKGQFPLGRPDTGILHQIDSMIAKREAFQPEPERYAVTLGVEYAGVTLKLTPCEVWDEKGDAMKIHNRLCQLGGDTIKCEVVELSKEHYDREELFNREELQIAALETLGFLPQQTNELAVSLFEKGLITSPWTSSMLLPKRMKKELVKRYPGAKHFPFDDNSLCTYGHAIIPTGRNPIFLTEDEQWLYGLICNHTEMVFDQPKYTYTLVVEATIDGITYYGDATVPSDFKITGEDNEGYIPLKVLGSSVSSFSKKHPGNVKASELLKDAYEGLNMEKMSDAEYPDTPVHDMGLALQHLIDNGLVSILFGELAITEKGKALIALTRHSRLGDFIGFTNQMGELDALTWDWSTGTMTRYDAFCKWLEPAIKEIITNTKLFNSKEMTHKCPKCGKATLRQFPAAISCKHCNFAMPRTFRGHDFTEKEVSQLLTHRYTSPIYGFRNRKGRKYSEALCLDADFRLTPAPHAANIY